MIVYAFALSCAFSSTDTANNFVTPVLYVFNIFAGGYISESTFPRGGAWVKFLSPIRFTYYGYVYNEFEGQ